MFQVLYSCLEIVPCVPHINICQKSFIMEIKMKKCAIYGRSSRFKSGFLAYPPVTLNDSEFMLEISKEKLLLYVIMECLSLIKAKNTIRNI